MMTMYPSLSNTNMAANTRKPMMNATNLGVETMFPSAKNNLA